MWHSMKFSFSSSVQLFLIYVNDMSQAAEWDLYLYADDSFMLFQHKSVTEINSYPKPSAISVVDL